GRERMLCAYSRVKGLESTYERGLAVWNDQRELFESIKRVEVNEHRLPTGHPLAVKVDGVDYFYFALPYPPMRVRATWKDVINPDAYECFAPTNDGTPPFTWRRNAQVLTLPEQMKRIKAGTMKQEDAWWQCRDVESGKIVVSGGGSVCWNDFKKKY